jgi:DNA-directed RNA polymerase specialized sigma24 family protein
LPAISRRRQERIWAVVDMHLGGVKTSEISQYFGIGQRMVQRDLQDAQRLMREQVQGLDSGSTLGREIRLKNDG